MYNKSYPVGPELLQRSCGGIANFLVLSLKDPGSNIFVDKIFSDSV